MRKIPARRTVKNKVELVKLQWFNSQTFDYVGQMIWQVIPDRATHFPSSESIHLAAIWLTKTGFTKTGVWRNFARFFIAVIVKCVYDIVTNSIESIYWLQYSHSNMLAIIFEFIEIIFHIQSALSLQFHFSRWVHWRDISWNLALEKIWRDASYDSNCDVAEKKPTLVG